MKTFTFNSKPPNIERLLQKPHGSDFFTKTFKYASLAFARKNGNSYVNYVLDSFNFRGEHSHVLVDVKLHYLKKGDIPCIPGWHCDTVVNPFDKTRPEIHHIFIASSIDTNIASTEFIGTSVDLDVDDSLQHRELLSFFQKQLKERTFSVEKALPNAVTTYGRWHFHRGPEAQADQIRILIRATETDVVKPRNAFTKQRGQVWRKKKKDA